MYHILILTYLVLYMFVYALSIYKPYTHVHLSLQRHKESHSIHLERSEFVHIYLLYTCIVPTHQHATDNYMLLAHTVA